MAKLDVTARQALPAAALGVYARWALSRQFGALRLQMTDPLEVSGPLIVQATHGSWWDGHLAVLLGLIARRPLLVPTLAGNTARYPFLRRAGAVGFDPADARSVAALARLVIRACEPASAHPPLVVVFPTGYIVPPELRPIPSGGLSALLAWGARPVPIRSLAVSLRYVGNPKASVWLRLGPVVDTTAFTSRRALQVALRDDLTVAADALAADLLAGRTDGYAAVLRGSLSAAERWDALRGRPRVEF